MTQDELKMVLEALKWSKPHEDAVISHSEAIIALEEALAQPEQEPVISKWVLREVYFDEDGEPTMHRSTPQRTEPVIDQSAAIRIATVLGWTPPRTWIGLTDEEIEQGCKESWVTLQAWQSGVWWAEARLKQKNGYAEEKNI